MALCLWSIGLLYSINSFLFSSVEMEEESCRDCTTWQEDMYWSHFQFTRFSQFLHTGFERRLLIPQKFMKNLKKKVPDVVTLKSPSGAAWKVGLTANGSSFYFDHGWQEFVKDHSLEQEDFLIFKYNGDSQFDVLIFEGRSMCEKMTSYFVKKCGHGEPDSVQQCQTKRKSGESSVEDVFASPKDAAGVLQAERSSYIDVATIPSALPIMTDVVNKRTRTEMYPFRNMKYLINEEPSTFAEEVEADPAFELASLDDKMDNVGDVSSGEPVTEAGKNNALRLAKAAVTHEGFIAVMKPLNVNGKFFMSIPHAWFAKHLLHVGNQEVILRYKEKTWQTRFYHPKDHNSGGFSYGWRHFALENDLREFDVCVFEPCSQKNEPFVLKVKIFRAAQEETCTTPASVRSWKGVQSSNQSPFSLS